MFCMTMYVTVIFGFVLGTIGLTQGSLPNIEYSTDDLYHMMQQMNQTIENMQQQLASCKSTPPVAFYAKLSHNIDVAGDHQTIEYDHVMTNIGSAYDPRHGHFVAPVNGVYMFAVTAVGEPNEALHLDIMKNGITVGFARAAYTAEYESGTSVITLSLVTGDMVWVRYGTSYGSASRKLHEAFNTFSGALISAS